MKPRASLGLALGAAVIFAVALWRLFDLRFSAGDVYPPGSTLRADALGSRAFYESLGLLSGRTVQRSVSPLSTVRGSPDMALFLLGVDPEERWLRAADREALDNLLAAGGRVVITFAAAEAASSNTNFAGRMPSGPGAEEEPPSLQSVVDAVGVRLQTTVASDTPSARAEADREPAAPPFLPTQIPWRSPAAFADLATNWNVIFTRGDQPVIIERAQGRGTLVLLADNGLLTNEALRRERVPVLLAWLAGPHAQLVFDETHLGTRLDPGIMTLVRRYGLTGVLFGLGLVAGLYVWRACTSLIPRLPEPPAGTREVITGRDSAAGFAFLLRRSVPAPELLPLCLAEWRQSVPRDRADLLRKAVDMQDLVNLEADRPPREQNPVLTYRQLAEILAQR